MTSTAACFGAPVIEAAGNRAVKISAILAETSVLTVEVICHTLGYRSTPNNSSTDTLPVDDKRARSLRTISVIMTFSARFFADVCNQCALASSARVSALRPTVPFMGLLHTTPASRSKNSSGEAEQTVTSGPLMKTACGMSCDQRAKSARVTCPSFDIRDVRLI